MKPRKAIPRASQKRLAQSKGKPLFSTIRKRPRSKGERQAIPKVNVEATRKRRARNAKRMRGEEYQAARAGAMERAGGRCEFEEVIRERYGPWANRFGVAIRCPETERLQFHEEHYARGRILTADDGKMLCPLHHQLVELAKPHKWGKRSFA